MSNPRSRYRSATVSTFASIAICFLNCHTDPPPGEPGHAISLRLRFRLPHKSGTVMPVRPLFAKAYGYDRHLETYRPAGDQFRSEKGAKEGCGRGKGADNQARHPPERRHQ